MSSAALTLDQEVWRPKVNPWLIAVVVAMAAFMEVLDTSIANVALPVHGRQSRREQRSEHLGADFLSGFECHHPADQRLARRRLGTEALFHVLFGRLYGEFFALRYCAESRVSSFVSSAARRGRRRVAADGAGHSGRHFSAATARLGVCALWHHGDHGADHRSDPGRVDHLQLFLAVDFLHQSAGRHRHMVSGSALRRRSSLSSDGSSRPGSSWTTLASLCWPWASERCRCLLDKGQEDDWFGSRFITTLIVVATVCLISLVIWEWFQKSPIIDVRMFKSFNFASANLMMFTLGILLFSSLVLMPQFLQTLVGYTSELAGLALSAGGAGFAD